MRTFGPRLLWTAALSSIAALAQAQSTDSLEEIQVTAHRLEETLPQQLSEYGTRVETISREEIRNGSYVDVSQSLQALTPGLYLQPKNGPFDYADISLLGSRTEDVLWLVDGVRINNRLYGGTPPVDTLPANIVERMEVLEGGQALFYGTSAVAGAINIVTKPFSDTLQASVGVAGDSNRNRHLDGYFSDAFGRNHLVLYASGDKTEGYRAFRQQDYQPSSTDRDRGYDVKTVGTKYAYDLTDALRVSASYQHTDADLDYALPYRVARDVNSRREDLATVKLDYSVNDQLGLYLKGYYHKWHTTYDTTYNDLGTPGAVNVIYNNAFWGYDDKGVNALARFAFNKGVEYFLGYDLQRYGGRDEVLFIAPNKETAQAVFAQVRTTPDLIPKTHLAAGVRYNRPDVGQDATVWSLSGQYDLLSSLFVRTVLGTNFRLPSAEELFADDPLDERGNPNLKPERSKSLNLSVGGKLGNESSHVNWELIGFARDIKDLIDFGGFDEDTQQSLFANVPGTVRVRGGEFLVDAALSNALSANVSFTRNRSKKEGDEQIDRIPERLAKATLDYHPENIPVGATLTVNYTGKVFATVGPNRIDYGGYAIVDLQGRYFFDSARHHRFSLTLQNALDKEYGRPSRGCLDVASDGPYDCSAPYIFVNLGLPRTLRASYVYTY